MKLTKKPQGLMALSFIAIALLSGCAAHPDEQAASNTQASAHQDKVLSNPNSKVSTHVSYTKRPSHVTRTNTNSNIAATTNFSANPEQKAQFQKLYQSWSGVPYQFGGTSKRGIDCSALMQISMERLFDMNLPRTTALQVQRGHYVSRQNAKFGDLIFFRTGANTRHVGLYLGNKEFMHASSSRGVMISRTDNPYWSSKFWQFRRYDS